MRLASFTVTNFRSITRARKITMGPITVLVAQTMRANQTSYER